MNKCAVRKIYKKPPPSEPPLQAQNSYCCSAAINKLKKERAEQGEASSLEHQGPQGPKSHLHCHLSEPHIFPVPASKSLSPSDRSFVQQSPAGIPSSVNCYRPSPDPEASNSGACFLLSLKASPPSASPHPHIHTYQSWNAGKSHPSLSSHY